METNMMCRVVAEITIENLEDRWAVAHGSLAPKQVRRVTVTDALAATGATMLSLPTKLIHQLGLTKSGSRRISTASGLGQADVYGTVWLTIQGRDCLLDVMEVPDSVPVLIGQIPLERLDFVVDPQGRRLIGNPAHNGEYIIDAFWRRFSVQKLPAGHSLLCSGVEPYSGNFSNRLGTKSTPELTRNAERAISRRFAFSKVPARIYVKLARTAKPSVSRS
jgi:predicted aspartyl protease